MCAGLMVYRFGNGTWEGRAGHNAICNDNGTGESTPVCKRQNGRLRDYYSTTITARFHSHTRSVPKALRMHAAAAILLYAATDPAGTHRLLHWQRTGGPTHSRPKKRPSNCRS
jgi:hypothetical protein